MSDNDNEEIEYCPHDDFDYELIYAEYNNETPKIEEILKRAKKYGSGHRYLLDKFISEPSMPSKRMNFLFAEFVSRKLMKRHPEAVMRIQATPENSKELTKSLVKTINNQKGLGCEKFKPWRLAVSTDEKSPTEYITLTGNTRNSAVLSDLSEITKPERALLLIILEEMMISDGTVDISWVHSRILQGESKMSGVQCDEFMGKMARQKYFVLSSHGQTVEITPRLVVELEPWIRAKLLGELRLCDLCRKIVSRPVYTAVCPKCHILAHFNCFKNATIISNQDHLDCGGCKRSLKMDEVLEQIEKNKKDGYTAPRPDSPQLDTSPPKKTSRKSKKRQSSENNTEKSPVKKETVASENEDSDDVTVSRGRGKRAHDSDSE